MQIVNNKGLLIRTHNPQKVVNVIPKSKIVKQSAHPNGPIYELLVFWGYDETRILKNLGYSKTPSPIVGRYKWSGFHKPFDHQRTTAAFLTLHDKCFVFNEAGTGKTSAVIWAADYLMRLGKVRRTLVICPLSIMHSAWVSDLFKVAMDRTVQVAYGKAEARREVIAGTSEFVIINYDGVEIVQEEIEAAKFDLIICDEATALKNVSTKRWKTINRIVKPNTRLWLLTGTPAAQTPLDAYGLARLVSPARVPQTKGGWQDLTMQKITQYRWSPKPRATEIVYHALQPAIRFTKEECLDLPEVMYLTRDVELTPQQRAYYEKLRTQMLFEAAGEEVTAINAAVKMQKLLQISGGAVYSDDKMVLEFDASSRLKALEEIINETSKKVLVFVPYRHAIEIIHKHLNKLNIANELIHGDVSVSKRTDIFTRFQTQSEPRVLVIQPQAASHGVTLTAADTVVFWSPVMSVETYLQCIARIDRVGQKNKMTVHHIQGSTVERRIYKALMEKKDLHEELTDMYRDIVNDEFTKK